MSLAQSLLSRWPVCRGGGPRHLERSAWLGPGISGHASKGSSPAGKVRPTYPLSNRHVIILLRFLFRRSLLLISFPLSLFFSTQSFRLSLGIICTHCNSAVSCFCSFSFPPLVRAAIWAKKERKRNTARNPPDEIAMRAREVRCYSLAATCC